MGDSGVQELGKRSQAGVQMGDLAPGWSSFGEACQPGIAQGSPRTGQNRQKWGILRIPESRKKKGATGDYRGLPDQNFTENGHF